MKRKNKLSKYTNDELVDILNTSISFSDVLRKLDYNSITTGNFKVVKNELNYRNIEIPVYNYFKEYNNFNNKKSVNELFVENSNTSRTHLKKRIITDNLIKYECKECGNSGEWNGKKLVLQLEHKNGDTYDNRLENLCFLCPNCHSQTDTFSGKNAKKIKKEKKFKNLKIKRCDCGKEIYDSSNYCMNCYSRKNRVVERPSYEQLKNEIDETSQNMVAKMYNVSWHTITKWLKYYEKENQ